MPIHTDNQEEEVAGTLPPLPESATLEEVREYILQHRAKGLCCPACGGMAKEYIRPLNSGIACSLFKMRKKGLEWQHIPTTVGGRSREDAKARYWGLVEEKPVKREDGGSSGWWRLTQKGEDFLSGRITIPKYARIYNGELLGFDGGGVTVQDCLGKKFDYAKLMAGIDPEDAKTEAAGK